MKIAVLDGYTLNPGDLSWDSLRALGEVTVYDRTPEDEIAARAKNCGIILTNKTPLTRETIDKLPMLKYIGVLATGYNIVDCRYAKIKNIVVTNVPSYGTAAVAQLVFALLLELCHNTGSHSADVKSGVWTNAKDFCYFNSPLTELCGKTFGIIGLGKIGAKTAEIAAAFGMNIIAYGGQTQQGQNIRSVTLDEIFSLSDVLSLHCPLKPETERIINSRNLNKMKKTAFLINTSRGGLIDENDLAFALNSGQIAGAGLDVLSCEPPKSGNPLLTAKNCFITPHFAWAAREARERLMAAAVSNVAAFLEAKPVNTVN